MDANRVDDDDDDYVNDDADDNNNNKNINIVTVVCRDLKWHWSMSFRARKKLPRTSPNNIIIYTRTPENHSTNCSPLVKHFFFFSFPFISLRVTHFVGSDRITTIGNVMPSPPQCVNVEDFGGYNTIYLYYVYDIIIVEK